MPVIKRHQTLLDFAVQFTGSFEGLIQVAILNNLSPTDDTPVGENLLVGETIDIKNAYSSLKNEISTEGRLQEDLRLQGIDYWIIGLDFKVS